MDWTSFFTSMGVSGVIVVVAIVLFKKPLETTIERAVNYYFEKREREDNEKREADKRLFRELRDLLPSDGGIRYVRDTDMGGPIDRTKLDELSQFLYLWQETDHKFLYKEIDTMREKLCENIAKYLETLALNTFVLEGNSDLSRVPVEWRREKPERYKETVTQLSTLAYDLVTAYNELIDTARHKLRC